MLCYLKIIPILFKLLLLLHHIITLQTSPHILPRESFILLKLFIIFISKISCWIYLLLSLLLIHVVVLNFMPSLLQYMWIYLRLIALDLLSQSQPFLFLRSSKLIKSQWSSVVFLVESWASIFILIVALYRLKWVQLSILDAFLGIFRLFVELVSISCKKC